VANKNVVLLATVLMLSGLAFKLGLAPFHSWILPVYQQAPKHITTLLVFIPKFSYFCLLIRIIAHIAWPVLDALPGIFTFLGIGSIVIGGYIGMYRQRLWEILGASGIVNIGFCILALIPGETTSLVVSLTYLCAYVLLSFNFVVFMFCFIDKRGNLILNSLHDLRQISERDYSLIVFFVSNNFALAGMPPFLGFLGKTLVSFHLFSNSHPIIAVLALYLAAISIFFYLNLISYTYFHPLAQRMDYPKVSRTSYGLVYFGIAINVLFMVCLPYFMILLYRFLLP